MAAKKNYREKTATPESASAAGTSSARGRGRPGPSPARLQLSMSLIESITGHIKRNVNRDEGLSGVRGPHAPKLRAPYFECVLLRGNKWHKGDAATYSGKRWSYLKSGTLALEWEEMHDVALRAHNKLQWFDPELHYITSPRFLEQSLRQGIEETERAFRRTIEETERAFERERVDVRADLDRCIDTLISRHGWTRELVMHAAGKAADKTAREIREAEEAENRSPRRGDPFDLDAIPVPRQ